MVGQEILYNTADITPNLGESIKCLRAYYMYIRIYIYTNIIYICIKIDGQDLIMKHERICKRFIINICATIYDIHIA